METPVPPRRLDEMYKIAVEAVRERRLPEDLAEDCVQDVVSDLLADGYGVRFWPSLPEIRVRLARRADRGRQGTRRRRARERDAALDRSRRPACEGRSVPSLCPGLAGLARFHPEPRRFLETLLAAALWVAHEPKVLRRGQLRTFVLGYEDRRPAAMLQTMLKVPTLAATVQRLRRVSGRIECALVSKVGLVLTPADRCRLADWLSSAKTVRAEEKIEKVATPLLKRLSVRLEEALPALFEP